MATNVGRAGVRRWVLPPAKWWHAYRKRLSAGYLELIAAESRASRIVHFHPIVVPGLLQTHDYATAITSATTLRPITNDEVEMHVHVRLRRQRDVFDGSRATEVVFLLEEPSIRRPVGSRSTMLAQLDHLITMTDHPAVTLCVLPFRSPPHPALISAFMLIQYADARTDDVLAFEYALGNMVIRNRPDLAAAYGHLADRLLATGLSGRAAAQAIRLASDEIGRL